MSEINSTQYPLSNSIHESMYNISGVLKADNGKFKEALDYFNKAIENEPDNFVSYFNRASVRMQLGDISGARMDFKRCELLETNRKTK